MMRRIGRGIKKDRGVMNKLETSYSYHLDTLKNLGQILWWRYEPCNFELARKTFWRPDFMVMTSDYIIEVHEVKAKWKKENGPHLEDHAKVRIKVFSEMYPLRVVLAWIENDHWNTKEV